MTFKTPLATRLRLSQARKARYRSDPDYRLACINATRAYSGAPLISSLDEAGARRPVETRARDELGRFAEDAC